MTSAADMTANEFLAAKVTAIEAALDGLCVSLAEAKSIDKESVLRAQAQFGRGFIQMRMALGVNPVVEKRKRHGRKTG